MISDDPKVIIEKVNEQGKMSIFDGATEKQIASFEEDLS